MKRSAALAQQMGVQPSVPYRPSRITHVVCICGRTFRQDEACPCKPVLTGQETALYPLEVNRDGSTRHSAQCTGAFGRYDPHCHRCLELIHGKERRTWPKRKLLLGQQTLPL